MKVSSFLLVFSSKEMKLFLIITALQARSYIQSLSFKPTVPWTRIFGGADPKGTKMYFISFLFIIIFIV